MSAEVLAFGNHRKFIPLLRSGSKDDALPSWLLGKLFLDFRGQSYSELEYRKLIHTLLNIEQGAAPPQTAFAGPPVSPDLGLCIVRYFVEDHPKRYGTRRNHSFYIDGKLEIHIICDEDAVDKSVIVSRGKHLFFVEFEEDIASHHTPGPQGGAWSPGWKTNGKTTEIAIDLQQAELKLTLKPRWRKEPVLWVFWRTVPDDPAYELRVL